MDDYLDSHNLSASVDAQQRGPTPLVSVLVLAYNNGSYVFNAIQSVLAQRCHFQIEVLVGEDCSTDNTREEIARAVDGTCHQIRVFYRTRNLGMHRNYDDLLRRARGRYVADLDGDDVWVDENKLATHVATLESRPEVSFVFSRALTVNAAGQPISGSSAYMEMRESLDFWQVFCEASIPHSTVVFRRGLLPQLPAFTFQLPNYDWSMFVDLASKGPVVGLQAVTAHYTWHGKGSASSRSPFQHAKANWQQYLAHTKHYGIHLSPHGKAAAVSSFRENVAYAMQRARSVSEVAELAYMHLRLCLALRQAPNSRWLVGECLGWFRRSCDSRPPPGK